jgi:dTDP-glucose 4,6-dehydratase
VNIFGDNYKIGLLYYVDDLVEGIYRLLWGNYHLSINIRNLVKIIILGVAEEVLKNVNNPNVN